MKKLLQFTISEEGQEILQAFSKKYGTSKSIIIERALKMLAGSYHKKIIISYELADENFKEQVKIPSIIDEDIDLSDEEFKEKYMSTRTR